MKGDDAEMLRFNGFVRPGEVTKTFTVYRRESGTTDKGRPYTKELAKVGEIDGIISQKSPKEVEQSKQKGHPVTHTIIQFRPQFRAEAEDVLVIEDEGRRFFIKDKPRDPGELGHVLVYHVEEREDLQ